MGNCLQNLYDCDDTETQDIHDLAWNIQKAACQNNQTPLICHPNDLRDLPKALPNYRAAGKDGIPSQVLKDPPYRHIQTLAHLFPIRPQTFHLARGHRHDATQRSGATALTKYRPISLMTQLQKLYTKWLLSQCTTDIDQHIAEMPT